MTEDVYGIIGVLTATIFGGILMINAVKDGGFTADRAIVFPIPVLFSLFAWPLVVAVAFAALLMWVYARFVLVEVETDECIVVAGGSFGHEDLLKMEEVLSGTLANHGRSLTMLAWRIIDEQEAKVFQSASKKEAGRVANALELVGFECRIETKPVKTSVNRWATGHANPILG